MDQHQLQRLKWNLLGLHGGFGLAMLVLFAWLSDLHGRRAPKRPRVLVVRSKVLGTNLQCKRRLAESSRRSELTDFYLTSGSGFDACGHPAHVDRLRREWAQAGIDQCP